MEKDASVFIQVEHLSKHVASGDSRIDILNDVSFCVNAGDSIAILGESGSGKTTLLTLLAGLDVPSAGDIYFLNHHLNLLNEEQRAKIRRDYVSFIFQSFQLLPTLTALENVMLPLEINYIRHQQCVSRASEWLHRVGLDKRLHHLPTQLSGGEQQRVAIARAFVTNPQIIFADEMTGNLDSHTGSLIADILFDLNKEQKTTLLLVTHDESLAARCQKRMLLQKGKLTTC